MMESERLALRKKWATVIALSYLLFTSPSWVPALFSTITISSYAAGAVAGALSGAVGGAIGGRIGAFFEAYFFHPLARMTHAEGRALIARVNAPAGSRIGGIVGIIVGGVTGGFGSPTIGLSSATALAVAAFVMFRRLSGAPLIWATWATIGGAYSGAAVGYLGALLASMR